MIRELSYSRGGHHTLLTLRGAQGAVQADIWRHEGKPTGVIGIHCNAPQHEGHEQEICPILGRCYSAGCAFQAGFEVAGLCERKQTEAAWAELEHWYMSRLGEESK